MRANLSMTIGKATEFITSIIMIDMRATLYKTN
jgi:hypothetical protein